MMNSLLPKVIMVGNNELLTKYSRQKGSILCHQKSFKIKSCQGHPRLQLNSARLNLPYSYQKKISGFRSARLAVADPPIVKVLLTVNFLPVLTNLET